MDNKYLIVLNKIPKHCGECEFAVEGKCRANNNKFILYESRHKEKAKGCPITFCTRMTTEREDALSLQYVQGWTNCMSHHGML